MAGGGRAGMRPAVGGKGRKGEAFAKLLKDFFPRLDLSRDGEEGGLQTTAIVSDG